MQYKVKVWWDKLTDKEKDVILEMVYDMTIDDMEFHNVGRNKKDQYCWINKRD